MVSAMIYQPTQNQHESKRKIKASDQILHLL